MKKRFAVTGEKRIGLLHWTSKVKNCSDIIFYYSKKLFDA